MWHGSPIKWRSQRSKTVSLSTYEAEYYAIVDAAKESFEIRRLIEEMKLGFPLLDDVNLPPIVIFEDNQACIKSISSNGLYSPGLKHVRVKYHKISEWVSEGALEIRYTPTEKQLPDIFTKNLAGLQFKRFRDAILGMENGEC